MLILFSVFAKLALSETGHSGAAQGGTFGLAEQKHLDSLDYRDEQHLLRRGNKKKKAAAAKQAAEAESAKEEEAIRKGRMMNCNGELLPTDVK